MYKLIEGSLNDLQDIERTVLKNRGIKKPGKYLETVNRGDRCFSAFPQWNLLDNMYAARDCFDKHFQARDPIAILVDCDPDGYASAAMMYRYIKMMDNDYPVSYLIHGVNKNHGLATTDVTIPPDVKLLIIPDAGTNDCEQCNTLVDNNISVIILDHHIQDQSNTNVSRAIIVNNQNSKNYPNKDFCGAGVVYEFLKALDDYYWNEYADEFLDLVAFANISDSMDLRNPVTRCYVEYGLKHIKNSVLQAMIESQDYSMHGEVTIHNISWYVTPIFNAMIRIGDYASRELLFRAFIEEYDIFDYKKRDGEIIQENIYDHIVRLCKNCKSRQDRARDSLFLHLKEEADVNDKVIMLKVADKYDPGIIGLSAMKLADACSRPVILLREVQLDGKTLLSGSCRNFNNSPVKSLKDVIDQTGLFTLCAGHDNAAGVQLEPELFEPAVQAINSALCNVTYDPAYQCDFVIDVDQLDVGVVNEVDTCRWLWCNGISEPLFAIENITIQRGDMRIQGKNRDSITFEVAGVSFVQFKLNDGDALYDFFNDWSATDQDVMRFNAVCTLCISNYKNILKPQAIIQDVIVIQ